MGERWARMLGARAAELTAAARSRLGARAEFAGRPEVFEAHLSALAEALVAALAAEQAGILTARALELGRAQADPARSYGQLQLMLDVLCAEAAVLARRDLPAAQARTAARALRAVVGPAMVGLAELCLPAAVAGGDA